MKKILSAFKHQRDIKLLQKSGLFDEHYYLTHYPEAKKSRLGPLEHYVKLGSVAGMKPNAFFDDKYYRDTNPDIKQLNINPLVHFVKFGAKEGRNPSPAFNTKYYIEQHPDVTGTGVNPLWHFLNYGVKEKREINDARQNALSSENRALYEELVQIEPLLPSFDALTYVPLDCGPTESLAGRAYFKLVESIANSFTHLFVLRRLILGGADRVAMNCVKVVADKLGADSVLVLLADMPVNTANHFLPKGVQMLALDDIQPGLSAKEKVQVLTRLIIEAQPKVVHNVNSDICWQTYRRYHQLFQPYTKLVASLFTCHFDECDRRVGLVPQYMNNCLDHLDLIITDNAAFKNDSATFYALEKYNQDKIIVAYTPVLDTFHKPDPNAYKSKRILWASRIHPDKRMDVLVAIAKRMPEITFEVYGELAADDSNTDELKRLPNIHMHGPYANFEEIPTSDINAFLYTTKHEGMSIAAKEAIAAGLPVIAPDVGGIRELIISDTGWLITKADDIDGYVAAINECLSNPDERMRRIINAQKLLSEQHSWNNFANVITSIPAYHL